MKKSSTELKSIAKQTLMGRYALPMGAYALTFLISFTFNMVIAFTFPGITPVILILSSLCSLIISLLFNILSAGMYSLILNLCRNKEYSLNNLLFGFTHQPNRIILLGILITIITIACSLPGIIILIIGPVSAVPIIELIGILFLLAGLIFSIILLLDFSQVFFIYLDNPEKKVLQIMRESRELMRGNKGRLFYLQISFIGLSLLAILSCYIGLLWVEPYAQCTYTLFYMNLLGEI